MANISDAFGRIKVEAVGEEFLEFLRTVQQDAYYLVCYNEDIEGLKADENGDVEFNFSAFGRWNYGLNLEGYLDGEWMTGEVEKEAYAKFIDALEKKDGSVWVSYSDSETGNWWMGTGVATLDVVEGQAQFNNSFVEEELTLRGFADMQGYTDLEALEYLYGDEVADKYDKYVEQWNKDHSGPEFEGMQPASPGEWFDNEYQEEEDE